MVINEGREASGRMEASDWWRRDKLLLLDLSHCCYFLQFLRVLGPSGSRLKSVTVFFLDLELRLAPPSASQFVCMQRVEGLPDL